MLITYARSSSLSTMSMCETQYFLTYNLGLKNKTNKSALKGTILHRVMQCLGDKKLAIQNGKKTVDFEGKRLKLNQCDDIEYITQLSFDYYTEQESSVKLTKTDFQDCLKWAHAAISYNNGVLDPRNQNIFTTEKFFDFPIKEDWAKYSYQIGDRTIEGYFGLKGTIDLILTEDDKYLHVLDYKTGRRLNWANFKEKTYADLEYDTQLLLYYYALKSLYPDHEFIISIYYINDGGLFSFAYDEEHYQRAKSMLQQKFNYIRSVEIPRQASSDHSSKICQYMCAFSKLEENGVSICNNIHSEIRTKGVYNVIAERADFEALGKYTGGGRIDQ